MREQADLKAGVDLYELLRSRYDMFSFAITEHHFKFYLGEFIGQNLMHTISADKAEVAVVYDIGNDFYHWFLGDAMLYSCAIFENLDEDLVVAQTRKLDLICNITQMKKGDRHLDFGCGWGSMMCHAAKNFGTFSTGITLSKEQAAYCNEKAVKMGVENQVDILVMDYRLIPKTKYNVITCLEMSEHVGIKNYQKFLAQVYDHLEDDGIFYLQIAGLRKPWQMEDLVWGMFMGKYIFPAADASCPLGWDIEQVERAGFEVHRVENTGVHYARTIYKWFKEWQRNEKVVVAKYGQYWFRMYAIFLAWSAIIACQGSSTVYMITLNKNLKNDAQCMSDKFVKERAVEDNNKKGQESGEFGFAGSSGHLLNRSSKWIGPNRLRTQQ
jgi:cyclopropane fatty-acyl-phospholipid synthase-like methyltransferase